MNLIKFITSILLISYGFSLFATMLKDDFENYPVNQSIEKQNGWTERTYGKHPSCKVVLSSDKKPPSKVLTAFGSGDRHIYKRFPKNDFQEIINSKVIVLDLSFKLNAIVELGFAEKYPKGTPLRIICVNNVNIVFAKKKYSGILKINNKDWNDIRLIIDRNEKKAFLKLAIKKHGEKVYKIDPRLDNIDIPMTEAVTKHWPGVNIRLDRNGMLDDIKLESFSDIKEIPGKIELGTEPVCFKPVLDHLRHPRKASDLNGIWSYYVSKDGNKPGKEIWRKITIPAPSKSLFNKAGKNGAVWFRKIFNLKDTSNKNYLLFFEQVADVCEVYINGNFVKKNKIWSLPFEANISKFVKPGKNILELKHKKTDMEVLFKLGNRAQRKYNFTFYPKNKLITPPKNMCLFAKKGDILSAYFPGRTVNNIQELVKLSPCQCVINKKLTPQEGAVLCKLVEKGMRVLLLKTNGWLPHPVMDKLPQAMCWRRDTDAVINLRNRDLRSWLPDGGLGSSSYRKPVEKLLVAPQNYGGIYFKIVDPDKNNGASCLVLEPGQKKTIEFKDLQAKKLWVLGALKKHQPKGAKSIKAVFKYQDGSKKQI